VSLTTEQETKVSNICFQKEKYPKSEIRIRSKSVDLIVFFFFASFVSNLNDSALNKLLVRSDEKRSNLLNLKCLRLKSTDISDVSVRAKLSFYCTVILTSVLYK
jgi:hypothetical protein